MTKPKQHLNVKAIEGCQVWVNGHRMFTYSEITYMIQTDFCFCQECDNSGPNPICKACKDFSSWRQK